MRIDLSASNAVLAGLAVLLLAALPFVSAGFFSIDEVIYFMGANALKDGSLFVENGFDEFRSPDLKIWFLVQAEHRLTPQYPVGSAVLGAPLLAMFGEKGLIAVNALAGAGTLFATRSLANEMFGRAEIGFLAVLILAFGTFWPEYLYGHWPHSLSLFFVTASLLTFLKSLNRAGNPIGLAVLSGLMLGAAVLLRLDSILALPAYFLAIMIYASRPLALFFGGTLGLAPAAILIAVTNLQKFGTINPLSYGRATGGGTDASSYAPVAGVFFLVLVATLAIRFYSNQRIRLGLTRLFALVFVGAALLVPPVFDLARDLALGFMRLVVDAKEILDPRPGVVYLPDGTVSFWGFPKKALAQSLPWLGVFAIFIFRFREKHGRSLTVGMIFVAVWMLPFFESSWHGGLGSNMRYFLPMLPVLSAVGAYLVFELSRRVNNAPKVLAVGWICGLLLVAGWARLHPTQWFGSHQILSTLVFFMTILLVLLSGLRNGDGDRASMNTVPVFVAGLGIGVSSLLTASDFINSQSRRAAMELQSKSAGMIDQPVLFYGAPERFAAAIARPDQIVALPDRLTGEFDVKLIVDALEAGYVVLIAPQFASAPDIAGGEIEIIENPRWADMNLVQVTRR